MNEKRWFVINWIDGKPKIVDWFNNADIQKAKSLVRKLDESGECPELLETYEELSNAN